MASFQERLHEAIAEYGGEYDPVMRRSFQTVLMFEANRCLKDKLASLRPFQRKLAVFDQAKYLLEEISGGSSLVGLTTREKKEEIMWRTATSKEPLNPESMWSRASRLTKDVEKVAEQVREFIEKKLADKRDKTITSTSTHEETYRSFVENTYDKSHPHIPPGSEKYPIQFEYTHNHLFLAYKMYYRNGQLDPNFPKPSEREIIVPREKPPGGLESYGREKQKPPSGLESYGAVAKLTAASVITNPIVSTNKMSRRLSSKLARASTGTLNLTESPLIVAAGQKASAAARHRVQSGLPVFLQGDNRHDDSSHETLALQHQNEKRRRELLREVKDHMDLLNQFEGIIDSDTIKKRKRALFLSLPPPPPPNEEEDGEKTKAVSARDRKGNSSGTESDDGKNSD